VTTQPSSNEVGVFTESELEGLPEPVGRYLRAAIAPGTPLAESATLHMRGAIKLGTRWLRFRARQLLTPHEGFVWAGRVAGVITGSDRYEHHRGSMKWKVLGIVPVARGDGRDVSRSAAARGGAEAMWVPTALLPRFGVTWTADDDTHITARYAVDQIGVEVHYTIDGDGRVRSVVFDRWGDPDQTGTWAMHPFGVDVTGYATFGGVTIPNAGNAGWFYGTDRWPEGAFFRFEITRLHLVRTLDTGDLFGR
jgi:uncharacterized protein DUF6544